MKRTARKTTVIINFWHIEENGKLKIHDAVITSWGKGNRKASEYIYLDSSSSIKACLNKLTRLKLNRKTLCLPYAELSIMTHERPSCLLQRLPLSHNKTYVTSLEPSFLISYTQHDKNNMTSMLSQSLLLMDRSTLRTRRFKDHILSSPSIRFASINFA